MSQPAPLAPYSAGAAPAPWGGARPDEEQGVDWTRYLSALARFKYLIAAIIGAGLALGLVVLRMVPKQYTVNSTIWLQAGSSEGGPLRPDAVLDSYAWLQLLASNRVLDTVSVRERLYISYRPADSLAFSTFSVVPGHATGDFQLRRAADQTSWELIGPNGAVLDRAMPGDSIGRGVGFRWTTPSLLDADHKFHVVTTTDATNRLRKQMQTRLTDEKGNFIALSISGDDPVRLARTVNLVTERFVHEAAELKRYKLRETTKALEAQLAQTRAQLESAEGSLEKYKTRIITLPTDNTPVAAGVLSTQPTVLTEYFRQKIAVEDVRRDRQDLERLLASAPDTIAADAILSVPVARSAPELQRSLTAYSAAQAELRDLRLKYTDQARPVLAAREKVELLRRETIQNLSVLAGAVRSAEDEMERRIGSTSKELQSIPTRVITEQRLSRDVASVAQIYVDVQARYHAARLAEASAVPDVQVLDQATVPTVPDRNVAGRLFLMIVGASIGAALGLAILLDRLDKRFRYPTQVTGDLGLAILGVIPPIDRSAQAKGDPDATAQVVEAFRSVRLALQHAVGDQQQLSFTVTSPSPGDGKSLICSNLALSFAESGLSTLLVDGDIRRGELHRMFDAGRQPGLLDVLAGTATLDSALRATSHPRLALLPCGTRLQRGPELLGTPAMRDLMARLRSTYQVVIFDSPPLGAGIDPLVLGTATGAVVLILRAGETDRHLAEAKLQIIDRLPVRPLGAILNDVRTKGAYKYYNYVYGYTVDEDARALPSGSGREG
jgi:capsular exopolysaccharide synthesis family protein